MSHAAPPPSPAPLAPLLAKLGHAFQQPALLQAALTHPSFTGGRSAQRAKASPYERLEFLGDRVLGLVIAEWLYTLFPDSAEGDLAKRHAALVNRDALRVVALEIGLEHHLRLAHGEEAVSDAHKNLVTPSDAMEAVIGALYLDGGLEVARSFIHRFWDETATQKGPVIADPKTGLQEWAQGRGLPLPTYRVLENSGPAHAPLFVVEVTVKNHAPVTAEGPSKRVAEKAAAALLLKTVTSQEKK